MPARARHTIARRRDPALWPAILVTLALVVGAALTIVLGAAPPMPPTVAPAPVVAPSEVAPTSTPTVVVGKNARPGADCDHEGALGIDANGAGTVCRPAPDGPRWTRR